MTNAHTYVRGGQRVFRYDNAPHHPEILTFPHHKHLGPEDTSAESSAPILSNILAEVAKLLAPSE